MKILAFTDMHAYLPAFNKIKRKVRWSKPDMIICAGDISIFENGMDLLLKKFNKFKIPFLIIHGNHEAKTVMKNACSKLKYITYLHEIHYKTDKAIFLGYGGGGFSQTEPKLKKLSKKFSNIIKNNEDKKVFFITHAPPYKTKLDKLGKEYCGNKTVRWFVEKNRVDFLISGHIHENAGKKDKIKDTVVMNPGPYGKIIKV